MKKRRKFQITRNVAYWFVGYALLILMLGTNLPSPLYEVYREYWRFSPGVLTLIFATYVVFLIPSLLFFGRLSDQTGRRHVLILGLSLAGCGSVLFAFAHGVIWLFIARAVQGIAVGIVSGAATAALVELHAEGDRTQAALIASTAAAGGGALGPAIAGVLAQYGPWATILPYMVHIGLLIPAIFGVCAMPETVALKPNSVSWRFQRPGVPANIRQPFAIGSATAFVAWAIAALFMALLPSYIATLLHIKNLAVSGGAIFILLGTSLLTQLWLRRTPFQFAMTAGLVMLIVGLGGVVLAVPKQSIGLLLIGTLFGGFGLGLAFLGSMVLVNRVAPIERRGDVISSFYSILYLGVGIPIVGVGFGSQWLGLYLSVVVFALVFGFLALFIALLINWKYGFDS